MKRSSVSAALATALVVVTVAPLAGAGVQAQTPPAGAEGARLYQARCGGCHSIAANKVGPAHKGVFGRKAGAAPGYNYSPALKAANVTWDAASLDRWLQGPQRMVPGTRMFLSVASPAERAAIVAYLRAESGK